MKATVKNENQVLTFQVGDLLFCSYLPGSDPVLNEHDHILMVCEIDNVRQHFVLWNLKSGDKITYADSIFSMGTWTVSTLL